MAARSSGGQLILALPARFWGPEARSPSLISAAPPTHFASRDRRQTGVGRCKMTHLLLLVSASAHAQDVEAVRKKRNIYPDTC